MERLRNTVMPYEWGSRTAIASLLGRPSPSAGPEAELWIGTHVLAPSRVEDGPGEASLAERISASPVETLGAGVVSRFGTRLPFLLKVLAAEAPLSLQAHPNLQQARRGHDREVALGIPVSARHRNYKDTNHKPEILCALGPFDALCGFRPRADTLRLLAALGASALDAVAACLRERDGTEGPRAAFEWLMATPAARRAGLVREVAEACGRLGNAGGEWSGEAAWALDLASRYPDDVGVPVSLLLNLVRLADGEAVYLPVGTLHTYLRGTGVELMATSDNALRGGLTSKHVDVAELLQVVDFRDAPPSRVPVRRVCEHETEYVTAAPDFRLSRLGTGASPCRPARRGPELLLCVSGCAEAAAADGATLSIACGESVFVAADEGPYTLSGDAVVFRATVGDAAA